MSNHLANIVLLVLRPFLEIRLETQESDPGCESPESGPPGTEPLMFGTES